MLNERSFDYPFPPGASAPGDVSVGHQLLLQAKSLFPKKHHRPPNVSLRPVSDRRPRPLQPLDIPVVFLVHNERRYLPSFFHHYRSMGCTRFICVDDQSTDGSREYLLAQEDTDVFESNVRYGEAARGKAWREKLFARYGYDRWYLNVDTDEYFICEATGVESIGAFISRLQNHNVFRVPAVMLDLYPARDSGGAVLENDDQRMPWQVATHFDGGGYSGAVRDNGMSMMGGIRRRFFGLHPELIKYPLVFWNRRCSLGRSIHRPLPGKYNFPPLMGCLLHFKIFSDLREQSERILQNGQHFRSSEHYRQLLERLPASGIPDLRYEDSVRYLGPEDLIRRGFILPLTASTRRAEAAPHRHAA